VGPKQKIHSDESTMPPPRCWLWAQARDRNEATEATQTGPELPRAPGRGNRHNPLDVRVLTEPQLIGVMGAREQGQWRSTEPSRRSSFEQDSFTVKYYTVRVLGVSRGIWQFGRIFLMAVKFFNGLLSFELN